MQEIIIINGGMYEAESAVAAYIKLLEQNNLNLQEEFYKQGAKIDELKKENARLEELYQKSVGVIAATDCVECKRLYEGELNTELSGYRQNAIVFKPELMYTLKECEPKLEDWHNENPSYQNLQEIRYRAAKAEYDKIMEVLNGWGIKMRNGGAENEID